MAQPPGQLRWERRRRRWFALRYVIPEREDVVRCEAEQALGVLQAGFEPLLPLIELLRHRRVVDAVGCPLLLELVDDRLRVAGLVGALLVALHQPRTE